LRNYSRPTIIQVLRRIDEFLRLAYRYEYQTKCIKISEVIEERDKKLFSKIVSNPRHTLYELLLERKHRTLAALNKLAIKRTGT
jgi:hypothetical protein